MSRRMEVARAKGEGYIVTDGGVELGAFTTIATAFAAVLANGGRVHLDWNRTVIGGNSNPRDFSATFEGHPAGRIYSQDTGLSDRAWKISPGGSNAATGRVGGGSHIADTKEEAVAFIELRFTELMAGTASPPAPNAYAKSKGL